MAASHASSLRTLKALFDEGVLDDHEFRAEKAKLLRADVAPTPLGTTDVPAPTTNPTTDAPTPAMVAGVEACMLKMSAMADALTNFISAQPTVQNDGAKKRLFGEAFEQPTQPPEPTVWLPADQPTLFQTGVRSVIKKPAPRKLRMVGGGHKCPHCSFTTPKPGPLAMHIKHQHPQAKTKERSVLGLFVHQGASLSDRQQQRDRDVQIAFILKDIVNDAEKQATASLRKSKKKGFLQKKHDGRKHARGAMRRQKRSYAFKTKVILEYEYLLKLHPELGNSTSTCVADLYNISRQQVNNYIREKATILEKARQEKFKYKQGGTTRKAGMFPEAEATVMAAFKESRS